MSNEAVSALKGLPALLTGLALSVAETDAALSKVQIERLVAVAKYLPKLKDELDLSAEQAFALVQGLLHQTMRTATTEIVARGDVSVRTSLDVSADLTVGFAPYVGLTAHGAYGKQTAESWGCEVRSVLACTPADAEMVALIVGRAQERAASDPEAPSFLKEMLPDLVALLGKKDDGGEA